MFWRCHNKEFYLENYKNKALYLNVIRKSLERNINSNNISIHSYCVMDNHFHQSISYKISYLHLSNFMRLSHGTFGLRFNKIHERSGKVAESRPKTSLIQDSKHEMRVHFYVEANPIRSKKLSLAQLKHYKFSSYRYYAYGIKDEFSTILTAPSWYLKLGKTARERQRVYRKLFLSFIGSTKSSESITNKLFIGDQSWENIQIKIMSEKVDGNKSNFINSS